MPKITTLTLSVEQVSQNMAGFSPPTPPEKSAWDPSRAGPLLKIARNRPPEPLHLLHRLHVHAPPLCFVGLTGRRGDLSSERVFLENMPNFVGQNTFGHDSKCLGTCRQIRDGYFRAGVAEMCHVQRERSNKGFLTFLDRWRCGRITQAICLRNASEVEDFVSSLSTGVSHSQENASP